MRVATAAADIDNLRFYQRAGFRMRSIDRDAFTAATGYAPRLEVEVRDSWRAPRPSCSFASHDKPRGWHEVVASNRDGIGLVEVGGFRGHAGYDGVFLELPGTGAHLELTTGGGHGAPEPHPESLLVLYLGDEEAVTASAARVMGTNPVVPANPRR